MADRNTATIGFEKQIWDAACVLRGNMDASEYKNVVLGLIFLKYISDRFDDKYQELVEEGDGFEEDIDEYTSEGIFFVPANARWSEIATKAHTPEIGAVIDDAMRAIEKENKRLKDILPKNFTRPELDKRRLGDVVDLFTNIQMIEHGSEKDILGRTYEYCLSMFAEQEGKRGGEFFTPSCVVRTLVEVLKPFKGRVYDPCCGSGGMFVQSAKFVDAHQGNRKEITIYGQENSPKSYRLARMNLAIRGLSCDLGEENADSFLHDLHPKLLADYILANPPFNLKAWRTEKQLTEDDRWKGYATPPVGNANYAWILHMLSHLSYDGTAAFLLANGALNAGVEGEAEYEIRKKLIQDNKVEAIIVLPRDMFYATDISVTLWLCGNHKKAKKVRRNGTEVMLRNRENEILFIDAREMGDNGANDDGFTLLPEESKERIINTVFAWQSEDYRTYYHNIPEFCYSATIQEIKKKNYALSPSKYIKFVNSDNDIDYQKEMLSLQKELTQLSQKMKEGQFALAKAMEEIGYAIDKS